MSWNIESIKNKLRDAVNLRFGKKTKKQLIEHILELEAALYPFAYTLGSLGEKSWRGTAASSKLFPLLSEKEKFQVYVSSEHTGVAGSNQEIEKIDEEKLHEVEYYLEDSLTIEDGTKLHDNFEILAVHQQAPGAYAGCGAITMGDVRRLQALRTRNIQK